MNLTSFNAMFTVRKEDANEPITIFQKEIVQNINSSCLQN